MRVIGPERAAGTAGWLGRPPGWLYVAMVPVTGLAWAAADYPSGGSDRSFYYILLVPALLAVGAAYFVKLAARSSSAPGGVAVRVRWIGLPVLWVMAVVLGMTDFRLVLEGDSQMGDSTEHEILVQQVLERTSEAADLGQPFRAEPAGRGPCSGWDDATQYSSQVSYPPGDVDAQIARIRSEWEEIASERTWRVWGRTQPPEVYLSGDNFNFSATAIEDDQAKGLSIGGSSPCTS